MVVEPYPSEKWWTSSVGIMNFPTVSGNSSSSHVPVTTKQLLMDGITSFFMGKSTISTGPFPMACPMRIHQSYHWPSQEPIDWRYLPFFSGLCLRPMFQGISPQFIWPEIWYVTSTSICWILKFPLLNHVKSSSGWWHTYPSEKYESQLGLFFPIYEQKNVPNHQPETC